MSTLTCPLCGNDYFDMGKCPHRDRDIIHAVTEARLWAGRMYRRALKAEEELRRVKVDLVAAQEKPYEAYLLKELHEWQERAQKAEAGLADIAWKEHTGRYTFDEWVKAGRPPLKSGDTITWKTTYK